MGSRKGTTGRVGPPRGRLGFEALEGRRLPATFLVNTTGDGDDPTAPTLSLREAIELVDGTLAVSALSPQAQQQVGGPPTGPDAIHFDIPGPGIRTIQPATGFTITRPVTIDGYTQPTARPNALAVGDDAAILIELSGPGTGPNSESGAGLRIAASGCVIRGLAIHGFEDGIDVVGGVGSPNTGNVIQGDFIGTDATGTRIQRNAVYGISIETAANTIGGATPAARDVISGNALSGIVIGPDGEDAPGNVIQGDYIGTDASGLVQQGNGGAGIAIGGGGGNTIGGVMGGASNVVSGNQTFGIEVETSGNSIQGNFLGTDATGGAVIGNRLMALALDSVGAVPAANNLVGGAAPGQGNVISGAVRISGYFATTGATVETSDVFQGNKLGVDVTGTRVLPNAGGLVIAATSGNTIGGAAAGAGNVIGGNLNGDAGISIVGGAGPGGIRIDATRNLVQGNFIGTDPSGTLDLGNTGDGITVSSADDDTILGNVIAFNGRNGVTIGRGPDDPVAGAAVVANSIYANARLGIDLGDDGVTPDAAAGPRVGPNHLQNYPVLASSSIVNGDVIIHGTLGSLPDGAYTVEFFANPAADPSGHGQGRTYLTSAQVAVTDGTGTFDVDVGRPSGAFITATATDAGHDTSEFSASLQARLPGAGPSMTVLSSAPNPSTFGQAVSFSVTVAPGMNPPTDDAIRPAQLPVPTGMVTLLQGMQPIGSGTLDARGHATISVSTLPVGMHSIDAVYTGDANDNPSSSAVVNQVVNRAASRTILTSTPNPSVYGAAVTFTATVTGTASSVPTGTVTFLETRGVLGVPTTTTLGTATLDAAGHATIRAVPPGAGTGTIEAMYRGDADFLASNSPAISQGVRSAPTRTTLAAAPNPSAYGAAVTFTATVTGTASSVPTGTVTFLEGGFPLGTATLDAAGRATIHAVPRAVGPSTIDAVYRPSRRSANYAGSSSTAINQVVNPGRSTIAVVASAHVVTSGQSITLTATVAGPHGVTPTGTVTFLDGKVRLGAAALNASGRATLIVRSLPAGRHAITAVYGGNAKLAPSTSAVASVVVNPASADGPRVTGLVRYGFHAQPTVFVIAFNGPLDPARAQNPLNYTLIGPVGGLGRGGQPIPIARAIYDPSAHTVTLLPARALNVHDLYKLTIHGTGLLGVTSPAGVPLDGAGTGRPGSDHVTIFGRSILAGPASAYRVPPPVVIPTPTPTAAAVNSPRSRGRLRFWGHLTGG